MDRNNSTSQRYSCNFGKGVTVVEIGKVKELSDTHIQVTVIPADSVSVTQEVLPNVMTESPEDKKEL